MTLECAQSAMKSLKHRDISRVNIHSATFVYLHILSVSANLRRHVWDFIVRLCRSYIPSLGDPEKPEDWVGLYPINDVLQKLVAGPDETYCEPCLRDNEREKTSDYCLSCNEYLCMLCVKYHRKNMASRDHTIIKISEMLSMPIVPEKRLSNCCPKHKNEKIQMYCHEHEQPCCGLCVGTEHRKCEKVDTVENVAHILRESRKMDCMLSDLNTFRRNLMKVKNEEMNNISEIENMVDESVAKLEEETSDIMQHIEQLKKEHINEMFLTQKNGREKLQREIETRYELVASND